MPLLPADDLRRHGQREKRETAEGNNKKMRRKKAPSKKLKGQ